MSSGPAVYLMTNEAMPLVVKVGTQMIVMFVVSVYIMEAQACPCISM
jgi:hypothetical protein